MQMDYITFRSVTPAQRGQRMLQSAGIDCNLQRTPRWMEEKGCGYSLRLWTNEPGQAVAALRMAGVPLRKVYLQMQDGEMKELRL